MFRITLVRRKWLAGDRMPGFDLRVTENRSGFHRITAANPVKAYFLRLQAELDREHYPALVVDLMSGYILSINLRAFELLRIDAVGFPVVDFAADMELYEQIRQQLQRTGKSYQTIQLRNADGELMFCQVDAKTAPDYPQWVVLRLNSD
jgi:hypothetical protein